MLIVSKYHNHKKTFYTICDDHCLVRQLQFLGLCPTQNKDNSESSTVSRNKYKQQWRHKHKRPHLPHKAMSGMAVAQQPPKIMVLWVNQVISTGDEDATKEVVLEEAVTKNVADKAKASTASHTHHELGTSRDKWMILARY